MDLMSVAATSIENSLAQVQQDVSISLLKKTMDSQESQATQLIQQMAPPPSFGHKLDVYI